MITDIKELTIYSKSIPRREARYADYPDNLHPDLIAFLKQQGIAQVYCHQAEMYQKASEGKNLVITTATASGKTLSFLLPVLDRILKDPSVRAIFIYPTKALASDQYRALKPYLDYFGSHRIGAGVYDGDTPPNERTRIRKSANIILTNPEMLNGAFLPNHAKYGFDYIFANLAYVVIDELHSYRGVFGSHVANIFRRLQRVCRYYQSQPQFLCSSATIANPVELAEEICGTEFEQISRDGSPAAKRNYYLLQPPRIENQKKQFEGQLQATTIAAEMVPDLVNQGHSFLTFCRSRRNVEVVLREARDMLRSDSLLGHSYETKISGYRGGYTPEQRKAIERKMISGELKGLVSTNALELGIDIGKIDTTIQVGYPGTRASFWQQTGRAGRSGIESNNYMILESMPVDQYVGVNPDWLFASSAENAVIDKNNLLIELAHIRAAAAELPLTLADIALFPDLGEAIPVLIRVEELKSQNGKFIWNGNAYPAGDYSLRNMDQVRYKLMDQESHQQITEMDELQAFREAHEGAVYIHDGEQYQIVRFDQESHTAYAIPFDGNFYTMPGGNTDIRIIREHQKREHGRTRFMCGDVNVTDTIFMYMKLQFHNHQNLGYEELRKPLSKEYASEAVWIAVPDNVVKTYRSVLQPDAKGELVNNNHFDGIEHALNEAAKMVTMAEKEDIGVSVSANATGMSDAETGEVFLYIYDKYVGGLGFSQKAYECMEQILDRAMELVSGCPCKNGCAACVGDYTLDKQMVLWGLNNLREESAAPAGYKYVNRPVRPKMEKPFRYEELSDKWKEFCQYLSKQGEDMAVFLNTVPRIRRGENSLTLYTTSSFYQGWISDAANRKSILNIFSFYTDAPKPLQLKVEVLREMNDTDTTTDLTDRIKKRYSNLTEKK